MESILNLRVTHNRSPRFISLNAYYDEKDFDKIFNQAPTDFLLEYSNKAFDILKKASNY
jgi:hypothetical protein